MNGTPLPSKTDADTRILDSAADLFARSGYNGVSTRDIAAAAGVNEVTIYRHYPRKRDLYLAVLTAELQHVKLRGDLLAGLAHAQDAREALACSFELLSSSITYRPGLMRLVQFSALELGEDIDPMLRRHLGQLVEIVANYLQPWIEKGTLRSTNARALVFTLIAIVFTQSSLHRIFAGEASTPQILFETYAGFCIV